MRVFELAEYSGPEGLREVDRPEPGLEATGVVIEVRAIGINYPDLLATRGQYQYKPGLPYVPGCEIAGVVVQASPGSIHAVGDRVAAFVWQGGYAQRAFAPDRSVMALPDSVSFETGAGLVVNYQTVHFGLAQRGRLAAGESLLVLGSGGGIGTAAIQVGRGLGARVVAGITDDIQRETAAAAGAEEFLRVDGDFSAQMKELTDGRGFDMVLDPLGDRYFDEAVRGLAPEGRLMVIGFAAGQIPTIAVNRLLLRNISVSGVAWGAFLDVDPGIVARAGQSLTGMLEAGTVRPQIAEVGDFADIPSLLQRLGEGQIRGKAVVSVS